MKIATTSPAAPMPISTHPHVAMSPFDPPPVVDVVGLTGTVVVLL
jgi:hypothetical protein